MSHCLLWHLEMRVFPIYLLALVRALCIFVGFALILALRLTLGPWERLYGCDGAARCLSRGTAHPGEEAHGITYGGLQRARVRPRLPAGGEEFYIIFLFLRHTRPHFDVIHGSGSRTSFLWEVRG